MENIHLFTEEEKDELVEGHRNIIWYIARRFSFFDDDVEEIAGWGFLGLAEAISNYEENRDINFVDEVFYRAKAEIFRRYRKQDKPKSENSLEKELYAGDGGESFTIAHTLSAENQLTYNEFDMLKMINKAMSRSQEIEKNVVKVWLITGKCIEEIAKEYNITASQAKSISRRGQTLIKKYLVDNDIISEYLANPASKQKRPIGEIKRVRPEDYGKVRYITINYKDLGSNDISTILNLSSYAVRDLMDYPPTTYRKYKPDASVKAKVDRYYKENYRGRIPSEVITIPFKEL